MVVRPIRTPALALAVLAAAGCAVPNGLPTGTAPVGPTSNGAGAGAAQVPAIAVAAPRYKIAAVDTSLSVVVRYKAGKMGAHAAQPASGQFIRAALLDDTRVYKAASLAERDALIAELSADPMVEWAEADQKMFAYEAAPNDPLYGQTWGLPKIQAPAAWDFGKANGVKVAVVDTGVDMKHADLAGQVEAGPDTANNDNDPTDDMGHGTHVAGTIAAIANNAVGVAGVAPQADVIAIKVLGKDGSGDTSAIADGILAAATKGAKVINLSLGGPTDVRVLRDAVAKVQAQGVLVVAAAGNDGTQNKGYPAAYPGVIAVGASTSTDTKASFSTYGSWVHIAAPGDKIHSTKMGGGYTTMSGTSMACPHVAAVAAMVRGAHPDWSLDQVRTALLTTGAPVKGFEANPDLKRLDALAAMRYGGGAAPTPAPSTAPTPAPTTAPTTAPSPAPSTGGMSATATHTNGSYVAARAIDGDTNTEWQSGVASYPALTLDRGEGGGLVAVDLKVKPGQPYQIDVSDDGQAWRQATNSLQNGTWGVERKALPAGTTGRFVRVRYTTTGVNVMVFELKPVAGSATPAPSTAPTVAPTATPTAAPTPAPGGDVTAPWITGMWVTNIGRTSATVVWSTNEATDGQVEYGPTPSLGARTALDATLATRHAMGVGGLRAGTTCYFRVKSKDAAGNLVTSPIRYFRTRY